MLSLVNDFRPFNCALSLAVESHLKREKKNSSLPYDINKCNLTQNVERETKQLGLVVEGPGNSKSGNCYPVDKI